MENTRKPIYGEIKNETCPESPNGKPHDAILIDLINLGPLATVNQEGKKKTDHHLVWVFQVFPADGARQMNGQPHYFTLEATTSMFPGGSDGMSPSKSYQIVTGMRGPLKPGERYDFNRLVGKPCRLNIFHQRGFAKLQSVEPFSAESVLALTEPGYIADETKWPKAEMEYYFPEAEDVIIARLTDPDRFKKREEKPETQSQTVAKQVSVNQNDDVIPF